MHSKLLLPFDCDLLRACVFVNVQLAKVEVNFVDFLGNGTRIHLAFINFDRNLILGNYCECLPRERVVLEILETVEPDAILVKKLHALRAMGYRIALDDFVCTKPYLALLDAANFVKFDLMANDLW
jgi:c-di-GMP-related signal transduction protein